jgi:autotransporter-associated beta strand protein
MRSLPLPFVSAFAVFCSLSFVLPLRAADGVWTGGAGTWTNTANWLGGTLPGAGDAASFVGAGGTVTVPADSPFTLSALLFNTNGANVGWMFAGASTNTLAAPATVQVAAGEVTLDVVLTGTAGLAKTGAGVLNLTKTNLFAGTVTVSGGGSLRARADGALGLAANPVALDGAALASYGGPLALDPARVVTAGPGGAWFLPRAGLSIDVPCKVTGPGPVRLLRESSSVTLSNPANDYEGDTFLGTTDPGWSNGETARVRLVLGADEVLPDGGALVFEGDKTGILDLNGHGESVRTVTAANGLSLISSVPGGVLRAGTDDADRTLSGTIGSGATLEIQSTNTLRFLANAGSSGTLRLSGGTLVFSSGESLGGLTLALDGGSLALEEWLPGLTERRAAATSLDPNLALAFSSVRPGTDKAFAGVTPAEFGNTTQYGYFGKWYVPAAGTYSFAKCFDDAALLKLDGQTILHNTAYTALVVTQNIAVAAGWHDIEMRLYNGSGNVGPRHDLHGPFPAGIVFDPANGNFADPAAASRFEDPGDGSVLRTAALGTATNTVRARLELAQDGTLDRSGAAASPLVWGGDLISHPVTEGALTRPAVLTLAGGTGPFRVGSPDYNTPVVFDADIADANGVTFLDRLWIKSWPASSTYTIQPGAELAEGTPGVLGTGGLTLADWSLRIVRDDSAVGAVTAPDGRFVRFDATREEGGRLLPDPAYVLHADNDVALGGSNATVSFNGAGSVVYSGTISGTGRFIAGAAGDVTLTGANTFTGPLSLNSGRLLVSSDAAFGASANVVSFNGGWLGSADGGDLTLGQAFTATAAGGGLDAPDGTTLTLTGPLSGTIAKRGAGTLAIGGTAPNASLDLAVDVGTVSLGKNGAVRDIARVATNATVRLDGAGGDLITRNVTLTGGTLDLNGHSEAVGSLYAAQTPPTSRVVNNGAAPATLTVGTNNANGAFRGGWLADGTSALALTKTGTDAFWLMGGDEPVSYSGPTRVEAGTLHWGVATRYVRFTVLATRSNGAWPSLSEFRVLLDGEPVPYAAVATADASSSTNTADRLVDNNADTRWQAPNSTAGHWIKLDFGRPVAMNGYRWYTTPSANGDDPVSWRVEVCSDNSTWYTVDEQQNAAVRTDRRFLAGEWAFRAPRAGNRIASPNSAVTVAAGAVAQLNSPVETIPSLAGAGTVAFSPGATLAAGAVSGFTGSFTGEGTLAVTGAGGETAPLAGVPVGVTLRNDGAAPLTVVVSNGTFSGSIRDGAFPAGLAKRGAGTAALYGSAGGYTGDTRVEAGTLAIPPGGGGAYRYVRFTVTDTRAFPPADRVSLSEFQLTLGGVPLNPAGWVATALSSHTSGLYGPERAIDGNWSSDAGRWLGNAGLPNWLKLDLQAPTMFDGYQFYTATWSGDNNRDPVTWTFEGSNDDAHWTLLDSHTRENYPDVRGSKVGPFYVGGAVPPVPPAFWAVTNGCADAVGAVAARYLRFNPTKTRLGGDYQDGVQFAELELRLDGATVPWPAGTVVTTPGDWYSDTGQSLAPAQIADNIFPTTEVNNRWLSRSAVNPLTIDVGTAPVAFNGYRLWTAQNGTGRDPVSWTLDLSADGTNWFRADTQSNQPGTLTRRAVAGEWRLKLPARGGALSAAVPDVSRTFVAEGATLRLAGSAETVGPLTGTGTVELLNGATLGINAFEDAVFSGAFAGAGGTLQLAGDHAQRFTSGSVIPGDFTVEFRGGKFGGTLHVGGALTVTGAVAYAQPASFPATVPLFTFGSIGAASRDALVAGAASVAAPPGMAAKVTVTAASATLTVNAPGTVILLQ